MLVCYDITVARVLAAGSGSAPAGHRNGRALPTREQTPAPRSRQKAADKSTPQLRGRR